MSFKKIDQEDQIRPKGKACVLVYGYDPIEQNKIKDYAMSLNKLEIVTIASDEINNTLKQLIDGTGNVSKQANNQPSKAIVLNAVSSFELNTFVHNFRTLKLESPLFAMVTETSINWKFTTLIEDLQEERAMFMKMKREKEQEMK